MGLDLEPLEAGAGEDTPSVFDAFREAFTATGGKGKVGEHFDLPIPGRKVMMRFHAFDDTLYDELSRSEDKDRFLDFLAAACECILIPDGDGGWQPGTHEAAPVKFDGSLAEVMGWNVRDSREEILRAFEKVPMPRPSIQAHARLVDQWLNGLVEQREEDLLGES